MGCICTVLIQKDNHSLSVDPTRSVDPSLFAIRITPFNKGDDVLNSMNVRPNATLTL